MAATKITTHSIDGKGRLLQQYKDKPNLEAVLEALFLRQVQDFEDAAFQLFGRLNIDNSIGIQLDKIGDIIGQKRGGLSDSVYRIFIKAKIGVNTSQGDLAKVIEVWSLLTSAGQVQAFESYPAEISLYSDNIIMSESNNGNTVGMNIKISQTTVAINMEIDPLNFLAFGFIQAVAAGGVKIGYAAFFDSARAFAFSGNPNSKGFGDFNDINKGGKLSFIAI